jgi:hypothetical protein
MTLLSLKKFKLLDHNFFLAPYDSGKHFEEIYIIFSRKKLINVHETVHFYGVLSGFLRMKSPLHV